jgi:C4-dicarboxylate-specific signal transduction histidine kinase
MAPCRNGRTAAAANMVTTDQEPSMYSQPSTFVPAGRSLPPLAIGQFAASIAHEVDQPLAAIALHAQAALRSIERAQAPVQAQVHSALRAVLEASARASDIVRSMRMLAGQAQSARMECRIDLAIEEVLDLHRAALEDLGIVASVAVAARARRVQANPVQLRQLLRNLVANAIDALGGVTAGRRELRIAAQLDGAGMLAVTVHDSGTGMDADQARRAFDPMFTTKATGMGLGLAICRAIVDAHGGHIWAEAPAAGCVVGFALPHDGARRRAAPLDHHAMEVQIG